jgi:hypothetical protein
MLTGHAGATHDVASRGGLAGVSRAAAAEHTVGSLESSGAAVTFSGAPQRELETVKNEISDRTKSSLSINNDEDKMNSVFCTLSSTQPFPLYDTVYCLYL